MTQEDYISILFIDCGFTGPQRRDFLGQRFHGRRHADELTTQEKSHLIEDLKARKCTPVPDEEEDLDVDKTAKQRAKRNEGDH
jgi:hypothetical protein